MAVTLVTKTKIFVADYLVPNNPADGNSLEEKINVFVATLASANLLDVNLSMSQGGKLGLNPQFVAYVLYKG